MVTPRWVGSRHFTPQNGIHKRHIDMHWMVGNLRGTDAAFNGSRSASSNYGIENEVVHQYVQEKDYSYANGNTYANRYGVSIEHAGGWLLPDGSRMKPTHATHETSAQLCADIARRWGMGKLVVGVNIFPHNNWVATVCSGTLDIHWIAARANEIMGQGGPVGPHGPGSGGFSQHTFNVQTRLMELGYNLGPSGADGLKGDEGSYTTKAIKQFQSDSGLDADGIAGNLTNAKLWPSSAPAATPTAKPGVAAPAFPLPKGWYFGPRSGPVQSVSGFHGSRDHLRRWQQRMIDRGWRFPSGADGLYGGEVAAVAFAFQTEKGLTRDKLIGPQTWAAAWTAPIT